jgi:flavoprotein
MCDGWTIKNQKNISNFLVYCTEGTIFMKSIDATEKYKNANYISGLMSEVIDEVGASRVVQMVSDNDANFKAAGRIIMEKYNHIFWTPCAAYYIDLILEDIGKDNLIRDIVQKAQTITNFIYNHQ